MSLAGILHTVADDPRLSRALDVARAESRPARHCARHWPAAELPRPASGPDVLTGVDLVAPAALRPVLAAALATEPGRSCWRSPRPAARPRTWPPRCGCFLPADRVAAASRPGRRCRTSGCRRARTPSAGGWRCCAGWPTRTPADEAAGPLSVVVAPVRSRAAADRRRAWATSSRSRCGPATTRDLDELVSRLVAAATPGVDLVERRGEFAVRGGILDVFPPTEEHPLRVEFFGDTVEEIRCFAVADQRSLAEAPAGLWAPPCRELLLTDAVRDAGRGPGRAATRPRRPARQAGRGHRGRGHGVARAGAGRRAWTCCPTLLPAGAHAGRLRPGADPHPGRRTWSAPARSSWRRPG